MPKSAKLIVDRNNIEDMVDKVFKTVCGDTVKLFKEFGVAKSLGIILTKSGLMYAFPGEQFQAVAEMRKTLVAAMETMKDPEAVIITWTVNRKHVKQYEEMLKAGNAPRISELPYREETVMHFLETRSGIKKIAIYPIVRKEDKKPVLGRCRLSITDTDIDGAIPGMFDGFKKKDLSAKLMEN